MIFSKAWISRRECRRKTMRRLAGTILIALVVVQVGCSQPATPTPMTSPAATSTPRPTPSPTARPELTSKEIESIALASVIVEALVEHRGELAPAWWGSGTVLTRDGLILTNAHVVMGADALVISLLSRTDRPPVPTYYAEPIEVNSVLDLALIQITTNLDGSPVERTSLRLPRVPRGDSDAVDLGQELHVFGYPGVGGETLTFTEGTVSGFESEDLGGGDLERVWIKTDAEIAPGNSGGTAVNDSGLLVGIPTMVSADETAGRIGRLRPANLVAYLTSEPPERIVEASVYEPNDDFTTAYGPLEPGTIYTAYLHQGDVDYYFIEVESTAPIEIELSDIPSDVDYDLNLFSAIGNVLEVSQRQTSTERIAYEPRAAGKYFIAVASFESYSLEDPYTLRAFFNGQSAPPLLPESEDVTVQGRVVDANTGEGMAGATMALLVPGVTGEQFMAENLNQDLVQASSTTDDEGVFILNDVPRGEVYTGVVITEDDVFWEDGWLAVSEYAPAVIDLGDIAVG
jgi:serine protease Do